MIKTGDIVKVKDYLKRYNTYVEWFIENKDHIKPEWMVRFFYEGNNVIEVALDPYDKYEVLYTEDNKALIRSKTSPEFSNTFLFDVEGLELVTSFIEPLDPCSIPCEDMTIEEIEEKLGHKVRIVASKE